MLESVKCQCISHIDHQIIPIGISLIDKIFFIISSFGLTVYRDFPIRLTRVSLLLIVHMYLYFDWIGLVIKGCEELYIE